jgi:uncharacterized protein YecT (DUF1311 family)
MALRSLALLLSSAVLLGSGYDRAFAQHMNAAGVFCNKPSTTAAEAACFATSAETADRELNRLYEQVRSVLDTEERNDLLEAQRAWLKYRDLTCAAEYNLYGGGTGGPVTRSACMAAVTTGRIVTLKATYGSRLEK